MAILYIVLMNKSISHLEDMGLGSRLGLGSEGLVHIPDRPSNYNQFALLISMLITTERRASCSMFARSCKHPIKRDVVRGRVNNIMHSERGNV